MKKSLFPLFMIVALLIGMLGTTPVSAAAYGTQFVTSITYQNIGTAATTVSFTFYTGDGGSVSISRPSLAVLAASALYVGDLTEITAGFQGSGVLITEGPVAATLVQIPQSTTVKNRPLSNGFDAGSNFVLIPTVLKGTFNTHTIFSVQNVGGAATDVTVTFVPVSGSPVDVLIADLPSGAAKYFDMGSDVITGIGATFNGAVKLQAAAGGLLVASAIELQTAGANTYAFEGVNQGSATVYMPSSLCKFNGSIDASYAIQNSGTADLTNVQIVFTSSVSSFTKTYDLGALTTGAKIAFNNCGPTSDPMPQPFIGSAVITATGGTTPEIVAMGKIFGGGLSTAYVGFAGGSSKIALPYVRWTTANWSAGTRQRTYIAIQNVGADIVGDVVVNYVGRDGTVVCAHTITYTSGDPLSTGEKVSSNPQSSSQPACAEFGYYTDGFGGGATITGPTGSQLVAIARVQTVYPAGSSTTVGEDYPGFVMP